ncbi:MAG: hypothetical protein JWN42_2746 [Candidatus Angelobacter sp.]|jgi:hypothetical protein|nr:hypothetical protein [Candidatus Angelobacter sp.]
MARTFLICFLLVTMSGLGAFAQKQNPGSITIKMWDYCDPATFGAGCSRSTAGGIITFGGFLAEITTEQSVGAWRFSPSDLIVEEGTPAITVANVGGEAHTFTRVKEFGGGFVAILNTLSGTNTPAPECARVVNGRLAPQPFGPRNLFVPPGATLAAAGFAGDETVNVQCCIHPWMRSTINGHHEDKR